MIKYIVILIVAIIAIALVVWMRIEDNYFSLEIVNESEQRVDSVTLNGTAVIKHGYVYNVQAGQHTRLMVKIKNTGSIRFEVSQGFNRADMDIVKEVSVASLEPRRLIIKPGNHYIIGDVNGN